MERKPASFCLLFFLSASPQKWSLPCEWQLVQFPVLSPHFQNQPYHIPTPPPTSQPMHPWLWIPIPWGPSSKLLNTGISQANILSSETWVAAQLGPSHRPWGSSTSTCFFHLSNTMDGSCILCCHNCVTLVCPLCFFSSSVPIYPIPCIKFLIKITDVEFVFLTRPWLKQR